MGRKTTVLLVLFLAGIFLACSVSKKDTAQGMTQAEIQAAIEQTFAAGATATFTATPSPTDPPPTATPTDTPTTEPTATLTPTNTPTITATPDLRVILAAPSNFQLKKDDLPWRGQYTIPNQDWSGPYTNDEMIAAWDDPVMARAYLAESGRVTGYETYYERGNTSAPLPHEVGCLVIQFKAAEGAQKAITEYSFKKRYPDKGWVTTGVTLDLGDISSAEYLEKMDSGGNINIEYWVNVAYRNYVVDCIGWGAKANVTPEFVEDLAQKVLEKLQAADLSAPATGLQAATPAP